MQGVQAITFDVGGTLVAPRPSVGHVYAEVATRHGLPGLSPEVLNQRFKRAWSAMHGRAESKSDWAKIVELTFAGLGQASNPRALFEALYERFTEPAVWSIFPDVTPTLTTLRSRNTRMGIISNWDDRLPGLLDRLQLAPYFEVITISCHVGHRKPQREIFEASLRAFSLAPDQVLHVGDSEEEDVNGARRAGLRSIGIQRQTQTKRPDWISDLKAVLQAIS